MFVLFISLGLRMLTIFFSSLLCDNKGHDVKEQFYRARKELKNLTTKDLGYDISNNIYINESLTESNKALFKECVKAKKEMGFTFIWTSNGKIFLRKDEHSPVIHIKSKDDIVKKLLSR